MKYCTRCLYPENHPLNLTFNEQGICSGCTIHEEKDRIDWQERSSKLETILKAYKSLSKKNYDCIIPVSGARDSYFIVHNKFITNNDKITEIKCEKAIDKE